MATRRHVPRKRFGQHFLVDAAIVERIVGAIDPGRSDHVVEIGPGLGALTVPLLARLDHLHVIEIDRDLSERLRERHPADRLTVHQADALEFDFAALPAPLRVAGNLPYNISTPLLFHAAAAASRCTDLHFMLQQEVVDRMVAEPSASEYGRLSVMLQYRFRVEQLFEVPPRAFRPEPKVRSALVRLVPRSADELDARSESGLSRVVARAFSMRRKTLRNTLAGVMSGSELEQIGIDPGKRAQELPVAAFVTIANRLADSGTGPRRRALAK
ncbi:MAG TPA: 16S rRNA (adenine(1518)-N(6)/adenine(1519)-N(6))-dimethyltransferase RsmA [Burkholderiales bacterium]|nr:16S rRNA (adenine(1518)-N(6)/adenine(1519)-N(6))-dimethyltransferase RsmA [Burkholderiales bacterium]